MDFRLSLLAIALFGALQSAGSAEEASDTQPLWEIGVVGGGGYLPDYPAAGEGRVRAIGIPFAIYRGDILRLGDKGVARGILTDEEHLEIDLGVDAAFSVDSDDNEDREGMKSLDYLLEMGPRVTYKFFPKGDRNELDLSVAARAVISTDLKNWRYQGVTLNPAVAYRKNGLLGKDLRASASVGALFGFDGLNNYFYRVSESEARPGRERYEADDGYIGTEVGLGLSWGMFENVRLFGGVQTGFWGGSANSDSPLHKENVTFAVGGGFRWSIFTSEKRVKR